VDWIQLPQDNNPIVNKTMNSCVTKKNIYWPGERLSASWKVLCFREWSYSFQTITFCHAGHMLLTKETNAKIRCFHTRFALCLLAICSRCMRNYIKLYERTAVKKVERKLFCFKVPSPHFSGGTEENYENPGVRIDLRYENSNFGSRSRYRTIE
jgi:hypothetical protein